MLKRSLIIEKQLNKGKVLIIYGPRQVGKTTLVKNFLKKYNKVYILKTGDDLIFANDLSQCSLDLLKTIVPENSLLVIDEAQKIPNIGRALKLVIDNIKGVTVLVTGSSSFDLSNRTAEALTGRKKVVTLYPFSVQEIKDNGMTLYDIDKKLEEFMIYGMYPEVVSTVSHKDKIEKVTEIASSYLLKDILDFDTVKNSKVIFDLLKLIAFQIGSEVSTNELAKKLGIDKKTVSRYLDLLEKSFVLFRLSGFSRNLRKEISKMNKYYFYDLGVRNAVISNFNRSDLRNDLGQLWENFLLIERVKRNAYLRRSVNYYFWRTYDQKELDLIEECDGKLKGYEFKLNKQSAKVPAEWLETYDNTSFAVISRKEYMEFISY